MLLPSITVYYQRHLPKVPLSTENMSRILIKSVNSSLIAWYIQSLIWHNLQLTLHRLIGVHQNRQFLTIVKRGQVLVIM